MTAAPGSLESYSNLDAETWTQFQLSKTAFQESMDARDLYDAVDWLRELSLYAPTEAQKDAIDDLAVEFGIAGEKRIISERTDFRPIYLNTRTPKDTDERDTRKMRATDFRIYQDTVGEGRKTP
jgi:hypothetical protein